MLNDEYFIGEANAKIDNKNRIWIPKFASGLIKEKDNEVAIQRKITRGNLELRIYLARTYREILNCYEKFLKNPDLTYDKYSEITNKIALICAELDDIAKLDSQNRLALSTTLLSESDWQHGDIFKVKGYGKYLSITKNKQ